MEKVMMAPSAPMPEPGHPQQVPSAPPTYAQAVGQHYPPYPVQPHVPMPAQMTHAPMHAQHQNYVPPVVISPQPQQPTQHIATTTTTVFVGAVPVGPKPVKMNCPMCRMDIKTTTITENQPSAHIACAVLFLLGCCLCSCLPYCMDSFQSVRHSCPNCKAYLGTYKA